MGITEFPYIVLYINGDRDHNIHGPANEQTAIQILDEIERVAPKPVSVQTAKAEPVELGAGAVPAETPEEHAAHPAPAAQVDNHNKPAPAQSTRPAAGHETQPTQVGQVNVVPKAESSNGPIDIKPKEVGDWIRESPRHEPGYIEEIGQDDILPDDVWARQIKTALPSISYDVYPEPHTVENPIVEQPAPTPVFIERPPVVVERAAPFRPPVYNAPHLATARPEVIYERSPWRK